MRSIFVLISIFVALLAVIIFAGWLRARKGSGEGAARIYAVLRGRNRNFWYHHSVPVTAFVVLLALASGIILGWKSALAVIAGALCASLPVGAGASSMISAAASAYSGASSGDLEQPLRAGFRSGSVLGLLIKSICLPVMFAGVYILRAGTASSYALPFCLGAASITAVLHTGGEVYSSSYSLASSDDDFTDRSGTYIGLGADAACTYILSAAAAVMLSELAVDTSGVTSTFTADSAAKFPFMVYASGLIASVIGMLLYRPGRGSDLTKGSFLGLLISGILTVLGSLYFSMDLMQSRVYAWAAASGIVAAIVSDALSRLFSHDSKVFISGYSRDRKLGRHASVVFDMGTGLMSTGIYALVITAGIIVSYMFASFYGVALFAVGLSSIIGVSLAHAGLSVAASTASEYIYSQSKDPDDGLSYLSRLDNAAVRMSIRVKTLTTMAGAGAAFAVFSAYYYRLNVQYIDIMSLRVFCGMILGAAAAFLTAGVLISSVRASGRAALRDIGRSDEESGAAGALRGAASAAFFAVVIASVIGLAAGTLALAGFVLTAAVTGIMITFVFNDSGMHYENSAVRSLISIVKLVCIFAAAFLPFFDRIGGFLFR